MTRADPNITARLAELLTLRVAQHAAALGVAERIDKALTLVQDPTTREAILKTPVVPALRASGTRSRHGSAHYKHNPYQPLKIELHQVIFDNPHAFDHKQTFLHEVAHLIAEALVPNAGHGPTWRLVMQILGLRARRCATPEASLEVTVAAMRRKE